MSEKFTWKKGDVTVDPPIDDRDELLEKMLTAITIGVDPDDSGLVRNAADRRLWRRLARSVAAVKREGMVVEYMVGMNYDDELDL